MWTRLRTRNPDAEFSMFQLRCLQTFIFLFGLAHSEASTSTSDSFSQPTLVSRRRWCGFLSGRLSERATFTHGDVHTRHVRAIVVSQRIFDIWTYVLRWMMLTRRRRGSRSVKLGKKGMGFVMISTCLFQTNHSSGSFRCKYNYLVERYRTDTDTIHIPNAFATSCSQTGRHRTMLRTWNLN